jgi:hypothetical protein
MTHRVFVAAMNAAMNDPRRLILRPGVGTLSGLGALLLVTLTACTAAESSRDNSIVVRDSAGIEIVEHSEAAIAALPTLTLDTVPLVRIAGDEPGNLFTNIRAVSRRKDGAILVFDLRSRDLRQYTTSGRLERVIARPGSGPGEIANVSRLLFLPDDSLIVFDGNNRRVSLYAPDGEFVRQYVYPKINGRSLPRIIGGRSSTQWYVAFGPAAKMPTATSGPIRRDPLDIVQYTVDTTPSSIPGDAMVDTIAAALDVEIYPSTMTESGETYPDERVLEFGKSTVVASNAGVVYVGTNERSEVMAYDHGKPRRLIRFPSTSRAVTEADRARYSEWLFRLYETYPPEFRAEKRSEIKILRFATEHPHYERIVAGTDGSVWVKQSEVLDEDPQHFVVHDEQGRAVARVLLPARTQVFQVNRQEVLGVVLDDDDVPHVAVWRLVAAKTP